MPSATRQTIHPPAKDSSTGERAVNLKATAMTSPQITTLDVAPADATNTDDNLHTNGMANLNLTAEAQAPAMPVDTPAISQQEPTNENNTPSPEKPVEELQNGTVVPSESQEPPAEERIPQVADNAAIPNSEDLQQNSMVSNSLVSQSALSTEEIINALAAMKNETMMYGGFYPYTQEGIDAINMPMDIEPFPNLDPEPLEEQQIQAYAKLEFEDGSVYMNTYNIYIGRDKKAAKKALIRKNAGESQDIHPPEPQVFPPPVSESGGIIRPEDEFGSIGHPRSKKGRSKRSKSKASRMSVSSHSSQRASIREKGYEDGVYPFQNESDQEAAQVDAAALRPDPNSCPTVGIHPSGDLHVQYQAISRKHVKIAFNPETSEFDLHVLGRNGCFVAGPEENIDNTPLKMPGTIHSLANGSTIQIGDVRFRFILPSQAIETGDNGSSYYCDEDSEGNPYIEDARGKQMSLDHTRAIRDDGDLSSDDGDFETEVQPKPAKKPAIRLLVKPEAPKYSSDNEEEDDGDDEDNEGEEGSEDGSEEEVDEEVEEDEEEEETQAETLRQSIEEDGSPTATAKDPKAPGSASRKGPGRPPKNGVMSKRAEKEMKKQAEEAAAAEKTGADSSEAPKKGKVGRPRKHPLPDPETANKPKRKYTKRKPKEPQDGVAEGAGSGEGGATKIKKEKPFKPARSPTPVFNEADLTPEQLSKPSENYVVIIFNAMVASPHKEMGLPQIYNAIKRAYPFFACRAETKGWESSVRHNLSGNPEVFEKGAKDGKGHMWSLKPGATVDKEKKKKAVADTQFQGQPQNIQPHHPHGQYYPYTNYGPPNPNYPAPQFMHHPGQYPPPPNGYPPQQNGFHQPPGHWQPPHNYPMPSIPPALMPPAPSTSYSSPYAPKPPENNAPPSSNPPHASPYGPPPPGVQQTPQQPPHQQPPPSTGPTQHPPTPQQPVQNPTTPTANQNPQNLQHPPQNQPQQQGPFPSHVQAPQAQMQNGAPPQQHPPPPPSYNGQQRTSNPPPQFQAQSSGPPQQVSATPPVQQPAPVQHHTSQPRVPSPPQIVETKPIPPPLRAPNPEVAAKVEKTLSEFRNILVEKKIAKEEIIDVAVGLIRRDGDRAVPDPNYPENTQKLIIETLRGTLSAIEGSGFTKPEFKRSFPAPNPPTKLPQSTASPPTLSSPALANPSISRPPMRMKTERTDSGSPLMQSSIPRPASASSVRPSTPAAAAASTVLPAQSGNVEAPNGASAAISTPVPEPVVPVSDAISKPQQIPEVPTPVERPADVDVTMSVDEPDKMSNVDRQPGQIAGQKRSRDEVDDVDDGMATEPQQKRIAV